jgi:Uma2 family endonuclease
MVLDGTAMATTSATLMTAAEFARLPDDNSVRQELVKGKVVTMPAPGFGHGGTAFQLARLLGNAADQLGLGGKVVVEAGFIVSSGPDTVRGPDVAYVSEDRLPPPERRAAFFRGAPDLAVEVISPGDTAAEVLEKVREYLTAGGRRVWVVEARTRTVTVYRPDGSAQVLQEGDVLTGEDVLPGVSIPVRDIFAY